MKKTLIALLALGSMAMGEDTSLFTIAPTTTTAATSAGNGSYTSSVLNPDELIQITDLTTKAAAVGTAAQSLGASNFTRSMFSVQTNVGNGGSYTYEQAFKVEVLNGATITLTSIDVDFFAHNASGQKQNSLKDAYATLTLKRGNETLFTSNGQELAIPGVSGQNYTQSAYDASGSLLVPPGVGTFTLSQGIDLSAGDYVLTIDISQKTSGGTFIGIGHVEANGSVSSVPEPATSSLSLLALAGLCARRRKK